MKINRIKYKNYRCFKDVDLKFETTDDKNIALIVAHNGGGKTEMLFSFWWVLYGFDFKLLKNKEATPWSLNSGLYFELLSCRANTYEECSVELWFEVDDRKYHVTRTERFIKKGKGIAAPQLSMSLAETDTNGDTKAPQRNIDLVLSRLKKIVPPNILIGILFDGERMKQLAANDESSMIAVESIIKHITNRELFVRIQTDLDDIIRKNNKEYRKAGSVGGDDRMAEIASQILQYSTEITNKQTQIKINEAKSKKYDNRLAEIHLELEQHQESKVLEQEREFLRNELKTYYDDLAKKIDYFHEDLKDGYLLISKKLTDDVQMLLDTYDIPAGLTTYAVHSILERNNCICGNCLTDKERTILQSLLSSLPPDNINSTINEMVRSIVSYKKKCQSSIIEKFRNVEEVENKISENKERISEISAQISEGASAKIKALEKENNDLIVKKTRVEDSIKTANDYIEDAKEQLLSLRKEREESSRSRSEYKYYESKDAILQKFVSAFEKIDLYIQRNSLGEINEILNDSYNLISEDAPRGKKLYLVQYDKENMFKMVSYYQSNYDNQYRICMQDGTMKEYLRQRLSEEEIKENIILQVADSNSTGQSKINALAFAKSILNYSSAYREDGAIEISRSYPFIIDSPFTEVSDENLTKSASNIHKFAEQIILMISNESLEGVNDFIAPHVSKVYEFIKDDNESFSYLKQ